MSAQVVGVAQRDLMSGMGHNISGYVSDSQMMVQVSFLVVRRATTAPRFDPTQLRAYEVGRSTPILPTGGALGRGEPPAHAEVEGTVTFVVPRDGGHLVLRAPGLLGRRRPHHRRRRARRAPPHDHHAPRALREYRDVTSSYARAFPHDVDRPDRCSSSATSRSLSLCALAGS